MTRRWLNLANYHWTVVFLAGGLCAALFAWNSFDLARLGLANFSYIGMYGWLALQEGGFAQLVEIVIRGYISFAFYVGLKAAEVELVHRWRAAK